MRLLSRIAISLSILVFSTTSKAATDEWTLLTTPNFEFYAQYDAERAQAKLSHFEVFRYAVYALLGMDPNVKLSPMRIYAFSDSNDYNEIKGRGNARGFYTRTTSGPVMVIGPRESSIEDNSTLFHEYLHYIVRAGAPYRYPTWYDEGLATFFGTIEIDEESITFGSRPEQFRRYLKRHGTLSFPDVIAHTNYSKSNDKTDNYHYKFYMSAWLAVHFFIVGQQNGEQDYSQQLRQYLLMHNEGLEAAEAFEKAFNITPKDFGKILNGYAKRKRNRALRMARPELALSFTEKSVSETEAALFYSQLTFNRRPEVSKKYFEIALQNDHSLALAYEANNVAKQGDTTRTHTLLDKALKGKHKSWETHLEVAKTYITLAKKSDDISLFSKAYAQLLIAKNLQANAAVYRALAEVSWYLGQRQKAIDYALAQYQLEPSGVFANLVAGRYMVKTNQVELSQFFLNNVINWTHSESFEKEARKLLNSMN